MKQDFTNLHARLEDLPKPWLVLLDEYLDGNHEYGSIAANYMNSESFPKFREALLNMIQHEEVNAVYALVEEINCESEGLGLHVDTIFVVTTLIHNELGKISPQGGLYPDEFHLIKPPTGIPVLDDWLQKPVLVYRLWWD